MRRLPLVLAGLLVTTLAVVAVVAVTGAAMHVRREPTRSHGLAAAVEPAGSRALRVLHGWDRRRARAWSHGSVPLLRTLYDRSSESGATDCAMLAAYRARGLRVIGMRRQILAVRRLRAHGRGLTLLVTDRLASAVAVGDGIRQPLPHEGFASQTLSFRRTSRGWIRTG